MRIPPQAENTTNTCWYLEPLGLQDAQKDEGEEEEEEDIDEDIDDELKAVETKIKDEGDPWLLDEKTEPEPAVNAGESLVHLDSDDLPNQVRLDHINAILCNAIKQNVPFTRQCTIK